MAGGLDPVEQTFTADVAEYVAALAEASAAARDFRDANLEAAAAVKVLQDQMDNTDGSTTGFADALHGIHDALAAADDEIQNRYVSNLNDLRDAQDKDAVSAAALDDAIRHLDAEFGGLIFGSGAANDELGTLQQTFRDLHEAIRRGGDDLAEVRDRILETAAAAGIDDAALASLAEAFDRVASAAGDAATKEAEQAAASDASALSGVLAGLGAAAQSVGTAIGGLSASTWLWIAAVVILGPEVVGLAGALAGLIPAVGAAAVGLGSLGLVFYEAYKHSTEFGEAVKSALHEVEWDLARVGKVLAPVLIPLVHALSGVADALVRFIEPAARAAAKALTPLVQGFDRLLHSAGFAQDMRAMTAAIGPALTGLGQFLHIALDLGRTMMDVLAPAMKPALTFFNELVKVLGGVVIDLLRQLANTFREFAPQITKLLPLLGGFARSLLDLLGAALRGIMPGLIQLTRIVLPLLTHVFRDLTPAVSEVAKAISDMIKVAAPQLKLLGDAINILAKTFTIAVQAILGVIQLLISSLRSLGHDFASFWDQLVIDTEHAVSTAVSWMARLPVDFHNALDKLASILYSIGVSAMEGLLRGLESAAGSVLGFVQHIASEIGGLFGHILGILSPSRVFHQHGLMIMQGLAEGITAGYPMAAAAMAAVAAHLRAGGSFGAAPGTFAGAAGQGGLTVNVGGVTVNGGGGFGGIGPAGKQGLQAAIQAAVLDYFTRNGRSGLVPNGRRP